VANRLTRSARPLIGLAAVAATLLAVPSLASAAPHHDPSVSSVQKQLGELAYENTQLVEKFDQAQQAVATRNQQSTAAARAAHTAAANYTRTRAQFVQIIQAQYEGQSFGAAAALLDSHSGTSYLDRLTTLDMISAHTAQVVKNVSQSRDAARSALARADNMLAEAKQQRDALATKRHSVQQQMDKYRSLLAKLNATQRAAYQQAANPTVSISTKAVQHLTAAGTGAARKAVQYALDQVGKPYVFGAAGPGSFDCSGLTMQAWHRGGVSLPHSAADQYNYGHHVDRSALEPGDLIFFYHPIGHVTIYIDGGMMVSAPTEGEPVQVVALSHFNSDYVGATRLT
jgi:peptidoglycan DL-endopeptidase CwlO